MRSYAFSYPNQERRQPIMARRSEHRQASLFDEGTPLTNPRPARKVELAGLVEALLREIAATLVQRKKRGENS
jgi:hypothetical protein